MKTIYVAPLAAALASTVAFADEVSGYPGYPVAKPTPATSHADSHTSFNPKISVILDGGYSDYSESGGEAELEGFFLAGEAGLREEGFALGHTEVAISADIDNLFFGKLGLAIAEHDGETEVELEEAYIETIGLGEGFTIRAGRFFSGVGYLNQQHQHAWDFVDAPLIYRGLWGRNYIDDGLRASWVAPSTTFIEIGGELLAGRGFPASREQGNQMDSRVLFANFGGDFDDSNAWQAGISYHNADVTDRSGGGHAHGGGEEEGAHFTGDSRTYGVNFVYKWAPHGNYQTTNVKLQGEYFYRTEDGDLEHEADMEESTLELKQSGFYLQGIYQFHPHWRAGLRYDRVTSDAHGSDEDLIEESGLHADHSPWRATAAIEWVPSEFSRIRLQYNRDQSGHDAENQMFVQFTHSLGAHGAHKF